MKRLGIGSATPTSKPTSSSSRRELYCAKREDWLKLLVRSNLSKITEDSYRRLMGQEKPAVEKPF